MGPRLWAVMKAPDRRPTTGGIGRYFSCCLPAGFGDRAIRTGKVGIRQNTDIEQSMRFPSFSWRRNPCQWVIAKSSGTRLNEAMRSKAVVALLGIAAGGAYSGGDASFLRRTIVDSYSAKTECRSPEFWLPERPNCEASLYPAEKIW